MIELPIGVAIPVLLGAAILIMMIGPRMVRVADRLADTTGLGEAFIGAVLLGAVTSLPDIMTTVLPAVRGFPELAVGNALGGVLGQTAFLAIADVTYRRANLEHAAASLPNLVQATLLTALLGGVLVLFTGPQWSVLGVHPGSILLVGGYLGGLRLVRASTTDPLWQAIDTQETRADEPEEPTQERGDGAPLWSRFAGLAALLAVGGWALAAGGESLVSAGGLGGGLVGVYVTGVGSSLAELVVSISAIRQGALTLAVGNVIGGNTFDTLLVVLADVSYREGSVYAAAGSEIAMVAAATLVATAVVILGLLRRQRHGVGNIGFESAIVLGLYVAVFVVLATA